MRSAARAGRTALAVLGGLVLARWALLVLVAGRHSAATVHAVGRSYGHGV